jgi:YspA, cpYpsA-related SLOG family
VRLLVCGSRTWTDYRLLRREIEYVVGVEFQAESFVLIEGDARGADRLAGELARARGWDLEVYPAHWQQDGRAAGMRRNARMLRQGRPDLVLAFVDKPLDHSRGTADMVRRARAAGVEVRVIQRR